MSKLTIKSARSGATYKFGDYSVSFKETPAKKDSLERNLVHVTMNKGKESVWELYFFYKGDYCSHGDLLNVGSTKVGTKQAAEELDFLFHCFEDYQYKKGIVHSAGRTNIKFGNFLRKHRGWKTELVGSATMDIQKKISQKNNRLPTIMRRKVK